MAGVGDAHMRADGVIEVRDLVVHYPVHRGRVVHAVSEVSFDVQRGETLGIVGESGCGKSTLGRVLAQLVTPTSGTVRLHGTDVTTLDEEARRHLRRKLQLIFQDPVSSLNPARRVAAAVREGLDIWRSATAGSGEVDEGVLLAEVGLDLARVGHRRPHELSGGQCQRVCIARALAMGPDVLVLDEPVSALDVSVQAQIVNLLERLKAEYGLTMVFISHDLAVVRSISDRVMVMYLGRVCEVARSDRLFSAPAHPYSRALMASIPGHSLGLPPASELISGELPSSIDPPSGCRFRTRCPAATPLCAVEVPRLGAVPGDPSHVVACHHPVSEPLPHAAQLPIGHQGDHDVQP